MLVRYGYAKDGADAGGFQFQFSVNIGDTAAHTGKTNPRRRLAVFEICQDGSGNSFAVIGDGHNDGSRSGGDHHFGFVAAGMAVNVGEPFLQNTEQSEFQLLRQLEAVGDIDRR